MLVGITRPIILMTSNYLFYCAQQSRPFSLIIKANFRIVTTHVVMCGGREGEGERERESERGGEGEREGKKGREGGIERERDSKGGIWQRHHARERESTIIIIYYYKNPLYLP